MQLFVKIFPKIHRLLEPLVKRVGSESLYIYTDPFKDGLNYLRERILMVVVAAGTGLSLLALIPAVYMAWKENRWGLLVADLVAFALAGCLLIFRRVDLRLRSTAVSLITFGVGVFILYSVGFASGGPAWLFFCAVMTGLLLGRRAALAATLMNAAVVAVFGRLTFAGVLPNHGFDISMMRAIVAGINFIVLNAAAAIAVAALLKRLQVLNTQMLETTAALRSETAELLKAREDLKQENAIRLASEKALQQSERKYRLLAESIRDVIWTTDMNLKFTYISPATVNLQGWTPQEYVDLDLTDVLTPNAMETVAEAFAGEIEKAERSGSFEVSSTLQLEMRHKNGSTLWAEVSASFLLGEDGRPVGILGVTRDISERIKALHEKERLVESLERAKKMEALGMLAGGVAHDLNNVLSGIVSYPDLLLMDMAADSPLRRPMETIRESGKKAAAIVQDLLTLARRGVANAEVLDLNRLVLDHLQSPEYRRLLSFHPLVEVHTTLDPNLANTSGSSIHLSKTIMNLVSNAAEAMPDGGRIVITTENIYLERPVRGYGEVKEGPYVLLRVEDAGIGISPEDQQRIFEPFYTKKKMGRSGTGLGMAVVWGAVQDHRGYIDVQSTEGRGTSIDLYLPATSQPTEPKEQLMPEALSGMGQTVLVVDDVAEQREIAIRILHQLGYRPLAAASGEDAVDYLKNNEADLVILDMIMAPGIDGLETYRRILAHNPLQKAIIASGYADTDRIKRVLELGAGTCIKKPYFVEQLGTAITAELAKPMRT